VNPKYDGVIAYNKSSHRNISDFSRFFQKFIPWQEKPVQAHSRQGMAVCYEAVMAGMWSTLFLM